MMLTLIKMEMYKMAKKKEVYLFGIFTFVIPFLFIYSIVTAEEVTVMGHLNDFVLFSFLISLFRGAFIGFIIALIMSLLTFSKELEDGSLTLLLSHQPSRFKVIIAKITILLSLNIIFLILLFVGTKISCFIFNERLSEYLKGVTSEDVKSAFFITVLMLLLMTMFSLVGMLFALWFNYMVTLSLSFAFLILVRVLNEIGKINAFTPLYLGDPQNYNLLDQSNQIDNILNLVGLCLYIVIPLITILSLFKRMDIKQ